MTAFARMPRARILLLLVGACSALLATGPGLVAEAAATPSAQSFSLTTPEGAPRDIALPGDSDLNTTLDFSISGGAAHGSLSAIEAPVCTHPGGTTSCSADVTYAPAPGYFGPDQFSYEVDDGTGTATGVVDLTVRPVPQLPADAFTGVGQTFTATATHLDPTATVNWGDGSPTEPLTVSGGSATLEHVFATEGSYPVHVFNPTADTGATMLVFALVPGPSDTGSLPVGSGGTGTLTLPGVTGTLFHDSGAPGPASLVLATYPAGASGFTPPLTGEPVVVGSYDVRVVGATADDLLTVVFTFPPDVDLHALLFLDSVTGSWLPVRGSNLISNSLVIDPDAHTVTVVFDGTSFPSVTELTGTRISATGTKQPPRIDRFRIKPRCVSADDGRKPRLKLRLSQAADVKVSIRRRKGAERSSCPRGGDRGSRGRFDQAGKRTESLPEGGSSVPIAVGNAASSGAGPLKLGPGVYRVTVTASNANGSSEPRHRRLVVRPTG